MSTPKAHRKPTISPCAQHVTRRSECQPANPLRANLGGALRQYAQPEPPVMLPQAVWVPGWSWLPECCLGIRAAISYCSCKRKKKGDGFRDCKWHCDVEVIVWAIVPNVAENPSWRFSRPCPCGNRVNDNEKSNNSIFHIDNTQEIQPPVPSDRSGDIRAGDPRAVSAPGWRGAHSGGCRYDRRDIRPTIPLGLCVYTDHPFKVCGPSNQLAGVSTYLSLRHQVG